MPRIQREARANAAEQAACRPWLAAELQRVRPSLLVALGAMAAQTLFGNAFRISRERGQWRPLAGGVVAMATWHPAAVLRKREPQRGEAREQFFVDIAAVAERLAHLPPT